MNIIKPLISVSLIVILTMLFSCNAEKPKSNKAVIKGSFTEFEGLRAIIKSTSPYQLSADTLKTDANGNFIFETKIENPTYYKLSFAGRRPSLSLYLRPGDSLLITAESVGKIMKTVRFGGNAPIYNDFLFRSEDITSVLNRSLMSILGQEESEAMSSIDSVRALHADEIAALQKGNSNIDPYFIKIESAKALYGWAILHSLYPDYYNYIHKLSGDNKIKLSPEFDTYLAEVNLNDQELISLPIYLDFLQKYIRADYEKFYESELETQYGSYANYQLKILNDKIENNEIKAILAYRSIDDQVKYQGSKEKATYWGIFDELCTNKELKSDIENKIAKWAHLEKGQPIKEVKMQTIDGTPVTFAEFKGKWIYIDIWATWCNPCRKEIPTLKKLEKQFHGQDIVFMSISVDRQPTPWKKMVTGQELKGIQVWAGQNDVIKNHYKVNGIPRFMIFDPQGNIYDANAKRPSMGIETLIEDLLKK